MRSQPDLVCRQTSKERKEYQHAVQEELEKLEDLAASSEKERWVEGVWELWKVNVIKGDRKEENK